MLHTASQRYRESFLKHVCQTSDVPMGLVVDHASGSSLFTPEGREYLDFISGICVANLGHAHPEVVAALKEQAEKHLHVMVYGEYIQPVQVEFAELLAEVCPGDLDVVYFVNSGTEANEGALKLAKKYTGRSGLVSFHGSFHGDTHGSCSVTGRAVYREPFEPLLPGVRFLDFDDVPGLAAIDETTAAVIVEPVQGEGGIRVPSPEFLPALRRRCTEVGALLIFDEVQTGFGRTGRLFACEHWNVVPDVMTLAKGMGGGMPIGAFVSRPEVMETLREDPPLSHVTTFGGHPVSCAAGLAALRVQLRDRLPERADRLGQLLRAELRRVGESTGVVRDVRGLGLMIGLELRDAEVTRRFAQGCLDRGLILGWTLHADRVVRIAPPLTISELDLRRGLATIEAVLRGLS